MVQELWTAASTHGRLLACFSCAGGGMGPEVLHHFPTCQGKNFIDDWLRWVSVQAPRAKTAACFARTGSAERLVVASASTAQSSCTVTKACGGNANTCLYTPAGPTVVPDAFTCAKRGREDPEVEAIRYLTLLANAMLSATAPGNARRRATAPCLQWRSCSVHPNWLLQRPCFQIVMTARHVIQEFEKIVLRSLAPGWLPSTLRFQDNPTLVYASQSFTQHPLQDIAVYRGDASNHEINVLEGMPRSSAIKSCFS